MTGQFYSDKFSHQKKGSNKCILISGKWYTPSEVETLAGKKTRKWRQTLFHLDKPLSAYDLSAPSSTSFGVSGLPVHSLNPTTQQDDNDQHGRSTSAQPITPVGGAAGSNEGGNSPSTGNSASHSILIAPVLAFIKAFRLKSDYDSIKRSVYENFSCELVESAKKALWNFCGSALDVASLPFQVRRDSERRSQLVANLEDILN